MALKVIFVSSNARKSILVDPNVEVLMNLLPKTPFHSVITIKSIPPNWGGDRLEPLKGATIAYV